MSSALIDPVLDIAREAGKRIMAVYARQEPIQATLKADRSPLTEADLASHEWIAHALGNLTPDIPVLSEEDEVPYENRRQWTRFWSVDPLDGTKEFLNRRDHFTVNIALLEAGTPVLGVIYAPVFDELFWAEAGQGAWFNGERIFNRNTRSEWVAAVSNVHSTGKTQAFLDRHNITRVARSGSALKFCRLAQGEVDIYPRISPTMEWDIAAGQVIVSEAGCRLYVMETHELPQYNKPNLVNPAFIAARTDIPFLS